MKERFDKEKIVAFTPHKTKKISPQALVLSSF
jgi:hypothetical protein